MNPSDTPITQAEIDALAESLEASAQVASQCGYVADNDQLSYPDEDGEFDHEKAFAHFNGCLFVRHKGALTHVDAIHLSLCSPANILALLAERKAMIARLAALEAKGEVEDAELQRLRNLLNTPKLHDFSAAVVLEAAHQRERWGSEHEAGKTPQDWFWLLGFLGGKALAAHASGNTEKALHHTISSAAVLANWHAAIEGSHTDMRPGISAARAAAVEGEQR